MDVYERAITEAKTLTDTELKRGFKRAAESYREYVALYDFEQAEFARYFLDVVLDEYNGRRR